MATIFNANDIYLYFGGIKALDGFSIELEEIDGIIPSPSLDPVEYG